MIAQEAKFELINYKMHGGDGAFTEYLVKLHDADGVVVHYNITDYYNDSEEIIDTRIWKLSDKILDDLQVKNDSRLGKKILTFVTNEHFYRGDVLEAMYVKEMDIKIDNYCNREY
jgi:hypothetical protein